jgi:hypothetical protein
MAFGFTVTISDASITATNPGRKSSEVAFIINALETVEKEFQRGNGTVTSGTILGVNAAGVANSSLGSWTYTAFASNP